MRKVIAFEQVSLEGYFADAHGDMRWAHRHDPEWNAFVQGNAAHPAEFVFGRVTYEMMASFWPTPAAAELSPIVARAMNESPKVVFSRTLERAEWNNTRLVRDGVASEVRRLKSTDGPDLLVMGSGSVVAQLTQEALIDEYQLVVDPIVLGGGRALFAGVTRRVDLRLTSTRTFGNGNVLLCYAPAR